MRAYHFCGMLVCPLKEKKQMERLARTVKKDILKFIKEREVIKNMNPLSVAVMLAFQFESRTP